jgi:phosphopentomutase
MGKVVLVVIDSMGVGELPDASKYGDKGSNTLANTACFLNGINLPNFEKLGLGNIIEIEGIKKMPDPQSCFGKMAEKSAGKDTTSGHWEIAGYINTIPFPTYPQGFPDDVITEFENKIGKKIIGNKPESGTEIIKELGEEHIRTGKPIVYTSADSVFQIAAHVDVIPLKKLYEICKVARKILTGKHGVGRVIARPFTGTYPDFQRTRDRKDYSLPPFGRTILDHLYDNKIPVKAVGKIFEIFTGRGIFESAHTKGDDDGIDKTIDFAKGMDDGLIFTNLIDLDMIYGHRNDPRGYAEGLKIIDTRLPKLTNCLDDNDILILTADHGCDPTTKGTDHTREYVPILVFGRKLKKSVNLGIRESFSDTASTIAEYFKLKVKMIGKSFLSELY